MFGPKSSKQKIVHRPQTDLIVHDFRETCCWELRLAAANIRGRVCFNLQCTRTWFTQPLERFRGVCRAWTYDFYNHTKSRAKRISLKEVKYACLYPQELVSWLWPSSSLTITAPGLVNGLSGGWLGALVVLLGHALVVAGAMERIYGSTPQLAVSNMCPCLPSLKCWMNAICF